MSNKEIVVTKNLVLWLVAGLTATSLVSCTGAPGSPLGDPNIDVFPLSILFSDDDAASTNPSTITVSNNGTRVLSVSATTLTGSAAFSITEGMGPLVVPAGGSRDIGITFTMISVDTEAAVLRIESDDPDQPAIEVPILGGASNIVDSTVDQDRTFRDLFADPSQPDYFIDGSISVTSDMVVEAGVTIAFEPGAALTVQVDGSLSLVGTDTAPIVLTGTTEAAGTWVGVNVFSNHPLNQIRFAQISFGGSRLGSGQSEQANVYVQSGASLAITDTTIADSREYGLAAESGAQITEFARNSFARNGDAPARLPATLIHSLDSDSIFAGANANEYIEIFAATVEDDATWNGQDVPYRFDGVSSIAANVVVLPGFAAQFESDAELKVAVEGSLSAVGLSTAAISFTSVTEATGAWRGVNVFSNNPLNELTHCVVANGGSSLGSGQSERACVYVQSGASLGITNSRIESSGGFGLAAESGASLLAFSVNEFRSNTEAAVRIPATLAGMMDGASMFTGGNGADWVSVDGTSVENDATWSALDVPYRFEDNSTSLGAAITIEPGAVVAFASSAGLTIVDGGSLRADASAGNPILFTAESQISDSAALAGEWRAINFFSNSANNILNNVVVEFAGGQLGSGQSQPAGVYVQSTAAVSVLNSTIRSSGGFGIYTESGGALAVSGNSFSSNAEADSGTP